MECSTFAPDTFNRGNNSTCTSKIHLVTKRTKNKQKKNTQFKSENDNVLLWSTYPTKIEGGRALHSCSALWCHFFTSSNESRKVIELQAPCLPEWLSCDRRLSTRLLIQRTTIGNLKEYNKNRGDQLGLWNLHQISAVFIQVKLFPNGVLCAVKNTMSKLWNDFPAESRVRHSPVQACNSRPEKEL